MSLEIYFLLLVGWTLNPKPYADDANDCARVPTACSLLLRRGIESSLTPCVLIFRV